MGSDFAVVTSEEKLSKKDFMLFIQSVGGKIDFDPFCEGYFNDEKTGQQLIIFFNTTALRDLAVDEPETLEHIATMLGAKPQHCFIIEPLSNPSSNLLAVDFAILCAQKWPCIGWNPTDPPSFFTLEQLLRLQRAGISFDSCDLNMDLL
ncbi:hypothetical protein [Tengunoibacter tsumagoiensis]|uniref:Uncharacterized protein n=1 Tax=Tengunoibacter tsumagoiensis TaxID=2014871 RepID=A0A401ZYR9_9CHLR|nr:hypothetical protein [Tengunoibacter tsumagoiensis]GCE11999.1 hypothetical protein KTT_18580 [Tengunoibacter tsumagoiensis]